MTSLKMDRLAREENGKVKEKKKRESEKTQWRCFTVSSKDRGTGTEKRLCICGLIIELMDGEEDDVDESSSRWRMKSDVCMCAILIVVFKV